MGSWTIYTYGEPQLKSAIYRGQEVEPVQRIALAQLGSLPIELIEAVQGPSIFHDWVAAHAYSARREIGGKG